MVIWFCKYFFHSVFCLTTGPHSRPKRILHTVRSSASAFIFTYNLISLRSSSSCLCILPSLLASILPSTYPSMTCFRRQFYANATNPVSLFFLLDISLLLDSFVTPHFWHDRSNWSFFFSSTTFQNCGYVSNPAVNIWSRKKSINYLSSPLVHV
jgi:hypothetical protein